jgi:hypothetical protein
MFEMKLDERLSSFVSSNSSSNSVVPDELESLHSVSVGPILAAADTILRKNLEARFKLEVRRRWRAKLECYLLLFVSILLHCCVTF